MLNAVKHLYDPSRSLRVTKGSKGRPLCLPSKKKPTLVNSVGFPLRQGEPKA